MRDALADIIRQIGGLAEAIKIIGTRDATRVEAADTDKTVMVLAEMKQPVAEFIGEFGIPNVALLNGLLNFPSYQTDSATFAVKRRTRGEREIVEEFQFRNGRGVGADYRLMGTETLWTGVKLADIPWSVTIEPDKARVTEFQQLAQLYSEVEKTFGVTTTEGRLIFQLGNDTSSTHRASTVFAESVNVEVKSSVRWSIAKFKDVMKFAGANITSLSISSKGVLRVIADTPFASYQYFLLGDQRR